MLKENQKNKSAQVMSVKNDSFKNLYSKMSEHLEITITSMPQKEDARKS